MNLTQCEKNSLIKFSQALINQERASVIISAAEPKNGYWFGGGNMVEDENGDFYLVGRYRNFGDSRTGLGVGQRGGELAIFKSTDRGRIFEKILSFSKNDLDVCDWKVLSIEGSALYFFDKGIELFVSTEKTSISYPDGLGAFQKPGTGVWTIEHIRVNKIDDLKSARFETLIKCDDPRWLHVKDPFVFERENGDLVVGYGTHPFNWSSCNAGYVIRPKGEDVFTEPVYDFFPRGFTWDVAISRITSFLPVPKKGMFADHSPLTLLFYDGGESMRNMDEHAQANKRPRGYSCEEIGGLAVADVTGVQRIQRLSSNLPLFTSPLGSGSSRYVHVLETEEGYYATWQQSQDDYSQPLVMNFLSHDDAEKILS